jgi:hypothetical protein
MLNFSPLTKQMKITGGMSLHFFSKREALRSSKISAQK